MLPSLARPLLHTAHLLTFAVLFVSGLLLFVPGLRAAVTGGYSLQIRAAHRWGGVAFIALPVVITLVCGARNIFAPPPRRTLRTVWQGLHMSLTILLTLIFTLTGFVLWKETALSDALVDHSRAAHDWLTYAAGALVTAHLIEVGLAALVARFTAAAVASAPGSHR